MSTQKHLTINEISPDNYRYYQADNKNFSAERNYYVINQVLAENDRADVIAKKTVAEKAGNVADILASFAKYKLDEGKGKQLEQWLGKSWMTRIYGERLIEKIRMADSIRKENLKNGNTLYGGNFYLK